MKKLLQKKTVLTVAILVLCCPFPVFALCGSNAPFIVFLVISLVIFLLFLLINRKYFKIVIKSKKLFFITIIPLLLFPLMLFLFNKLETVRNDARVDEYARVREEKLLESSLLNLERSPYPPPTDIHKHPNLIAIDDTFFSLILYYFLATICGVHYYRKVDKKVGFKILKFCISVVIALAIIWIIFIIASEPIFL